VSHTAPPAETAGYEEFKNDECLEDSTNVVLDSRVLSRLASRFRSEYGAALAQVGVSGSVSDTDPWRWASWPLGTTSSPGAGGRVDVPRDGEGEGECEGMGECERAGEGAGDDRKGHSIEPRHGSLAVRRQFLTETGGTGFTGKLQVTIDVVSCITF